MPDLNFQIELGPATKREHENALYERSFGLWKVYPPGRLSGKYSGNFKRCFQGLVYEINKDEEIVIGGSSVKVPQPYAKVALRSPLKGIHEHEESKHVQITGDAVAEAAIGAMATAKLAGWEQEERARLQAEAMPRCKPNVTD